MNTEYFWTVFLFFFMLGLLCFMPFSLFFLSFSSSMKTLNTRDMVKKACLQILLSKNNWLIRWDRDAVVSSYCESLQYNAKMWRVELLNNYIWH